MNDLMRESLSYFGLYNKLFRVKKVCRPERVPYGKTKAQHFLYYEPADIKSEKIIFWVHGGGWNAGDPEFFDFVGQCMAKAGYRFISAGYRLSPKYKYPCQLADVCACFNAAVRFLDERGIDAGRSVVSGASAGAHLASIMCCSGKVQKKCGVDISKIIGFIGAGGPYSFREDSSLMLKLLLDQLFKKGYDRRNGEPVALVSSNHIPMLLIQSRHDGLMSFECAEDMARAAEAAGHSCEVYSVQDRKNTHSWYTAGMFLETREENRGLDKFFSWIEAL